MLASVRTKGGMTTWAKQNRLRMVMVTHDIDAALRYATHVLHLGHRQLFFGTAADYKQSDAARRFLGGRKV